MSMCPTIMSGTEVFGVNWQATETFRILALRIGYSSKDFSYQLRRIWRNLSIRTPSTVVLSKVLTIIGAKLKILYSIIILLAINMVYSFVFSKFSTNTLLHYISMLQDSLTIDIDSHITKWRKTRLTFLQVSPIRRYIEAFMSSPSRPVFLTDPSLLRDIFTGSDSTCFHTEYHTVLVKEMQCQF